MEDKKKYFLPCADDDGKPMCFMCGEYFTTMKSLYGHMKDDHSDSHWREILPLEPSNSVIIVCRTLLDGSSSSSDQFENEQDSLDHHDEVVDLMESLPRWTVNGRRGRPAALAQNDGRVV